ncbi:hypothetical protein JKF63_03291 [Porcisia hertigi]|uniref:Uncharacterized protein n=1 Tax=Porcisia hertigi TaxID=2761500 RepID=A0A836HKD1_9TRYP|nr:hypothetical protein JKF63_03291 [Porcisia hertigi]
MRSLVLRASPGLVATQLVPCAAYAACMYTPHRCIFVRELSTPAMLERGDNSVAPFPARLVWQFSSKRPRHLVLSVREPLPTVIPPMPDGAFEDLSAAEGSATQGTRVDGVPRSAADFLYGRLFLRPYNVAQLLTVLQGWSDSPVVMERERSSLTLSAALPSLTSAEEAKSSNVDSRPSEVTLTACFTRKTSPTSLGDSGRFAIEDAAADSSTDGDTAAGRDYSDSVYVDGDISTLRAVLRDADLALLTTHLESVLSDLFAIEHYSRRRELRSALDAQNSRVSHRTSVVGRSPERSSAGQPQYLSHRYAPAETAHDRKMGQRYQSRSPHRSKHRSRRHHSATASAMGSATIGASRGTLNSSEESLVKKIPTTADRDPVEGDYEDIRGFEGVEDPEEESRVSAVSGNAAKRSIDTASPSAAAAFPASFTATHTQDRGEVTMETTDRYTEARFVGDGSVAASEVQEVSRMGDVDVLRHTREAQGSTESGDSRTTVHATATTGAFRSTSGEVTGTFSYEQVSTTTEATSAKVAAAASAVPLCHETSEANSDSGVRVDAKVIDSQTSAEVVGETLGESASHGQEEESVEPLSVKPPRKRQANSGATAAGKKKTTKKKTKKTVVKRKASASTSAGESEALQRTESSDTMSF